MYYVAARSKQNLVNRRTVPIIFVPGIMGTRLGLEPAWDPDDELGMSRWIKLKADGMRRALDWRKEVSLLDTGTSCTKSQRQRGWSTISQNYYNSMLSMLDFEFADHPAASCPVYACGYDWRRSNADSATRLRQFAYDVLATEHARQLIFITHSMGGFPVRQALDADKELRNRTTGVIHIAHPARGAPVAYRRMLFGTEAQFDGYATWLLLGWDPATTFAVFSALPGAMELLPSNTRSVKAPREVPAQATWLFQRKVDVEGTPSTTFPGHEVYSEVYEHEVSPPGLAPDLWAGVADPPGKPATPFIQTRKDARSHLKTARAFHKELGTNRHSITWSIVGSGIETDVAVHLPITAKDGILGAVFDADDVAFGRAYEGDGTVPAWSATALHAEAPKNAKYGIDPELWWQVQIDGVVHDTICEMAQTQQAVVAMVEAILEQPSELRARGISCPGYEIFKRYIEARRGDKSAEIELRAAKWYREAGHQVEVLENPDTGKTTDLSVDGDAVEVKYSRDAGEVRLKALVMKALQQKPKTLLLVRGYEAKLSHAEFERIAKEKFDEWFHGGEHTVELVIIEEFQLPPLNF